MYDAQRNEKKTIMQFRNIIFIKKTNKLLNNTFYFIILSHVFRFIFVYYIVRSELFN